MSINDLVFYNDAMLLFRKAGHTVSSVPIFTNHSYKQVIYFDSDESLSAHAATSNVLKHTVNISHIFDLGDESFDLKSGINIEYYAIVMECNKADRSQTAHDIHYLLHTTFSAEISIVLFKCENSILLSIAGLGNDVILSDWFEENRDKDELVNTIYITNLSLKSVYEFVLDLIYIVGRDYYTHSLPEGAAIYDLIPIGYFCDKCNLSDGFMDKESIKELIRAINVETQKNYGNDYVDPVSQREQDTTNLDTELDRLSFELDIEEKTPEDVIVYEDDGFIDEDYYEFEYDDVEPEVFKDPTTMINWIEKNTPLES